MIKVGNGWEKVHGYRSFCLLCIATGPGVGYKHGIVLNLLNMIVEFNWGKDGPRH